MADSVELFDDFPGSMLGSGRIEDGIARLGIRKEAVTKGYRLEFDYNLHFHFGLRNTDAMEREVEVLFDCGPEDRLDRELRYVWTSKGAGGPYAMTEVRGSLNSGFPVKYRFKVRVPPMTEMRIANYPPMDHADLEGRIDGKARGIGFVRRTYGSSVEGRDLYYYELGDVKARPTLMFAAGYHPPEWDPVAIEAIVGALSDKGLRDRALKNFSIVLIPFLNPDGFARSMQGSNAEGINFHWHFFEGDEGSCAEAKAMWQLCREVRPVFFMDFHAFTFQSWKARAYSIPTGYMVGDLSKKVQSNVNRSLIQLCDGRYSVSEKIMAPDILVTRLRREFGTVTSPKFHINWQEGPKGCEELSVKVFEAILLAFEDAGIANAGELLLEPYGEVRKGSLTDLQWSVLDLFYFEVRPLLGKVKASLFGGGGIG